MEFSVILIIISLSCLHIFSGPDHYLPFIALSKSRKWSVGKTILWTSLCGIGHIAGSLIISFGIMGLGWTAGKLHWLQHLPTNISGWLLLFFGLTYMVWGFFQLHKNKAHKHFEGYENGELYVFEHRHGQAVYPQQKHAVTPWVMFVIFVLAPNEPMIPLLSVLGVNSTLAGILFFILIYICATVFAMLLMVLLGFYGLSFFSAGKLEKYLHVISGCTIICCGAASVFMGW